MSFSAPTTYIPRQSPLHALDARVKLVLLLAYSISLFFLNTWAGLGLAAAALVATVALGRLPCAPCWRRLCPCMY